MGSNVDLGGDALCPGFFDCHAHVDEMAHDFLHESVAAGTLTLKGGEVASNRGGFALSP
jgi:predicted amidohydrolase YtcJ